MCVCHTLTAAKGQIMRENILHPLRWIIILSLSLMPVAIAAVLSVSSAAE